MKKKNVLVALIGLIVMLLTAGLSGCDQGGDDTRPGDGVTDGDADADTDADADADMNPVGFVGQHGALSFNGIQLIDQLGAPVVLRGMSLFWSQWQGQYFNEGVVNTLVDGWGINLIRAPLGVLESGQGYLAMDAAGQAAELAKIETVVNAAIARGIYVIIDWHDHHADQNKEWAKVFFNDMAAKYGTFPNVIFEIWNEPLDVTWPQVKAYADEVIPVIRQYSTNIVLVGTPNYCQRVDQVVGNPVVDYNTAYSFHFYAGLHSIMLMRQYYDAAAAGGVPMFVSEWGVDAKAYEGEDWRNELRMAELPASGTIDNYLAFLDEKGLSWAMWSISQKGEASAMLGSTASETGPWDYNTDLRTVGQYMYNQFQLYR